MNSTDQSSHVVARVNNQPWSQDGSRDSCETCFTRWQVRGCQQPIKGQRVALESRPSWRRGGERLSQQAAVWRLQDDSPQPPAAGWTGFQRLHSRTGQSKLVGWLVGFFLSFLFSVCHFLVGQLEFETWWQTWGIERYCSRLIFSVLCFHSQQVTQANRRFWKA